MGEKEVRLPTTPTGWAIHLSKVIKTAREIQGLPRFPINVAEIAKDYSRNVFPKDPITLVDGQELSNRFEGALIRRPDGSGEWGIFYNSAITSKGRKNYTLGHELGHYLLHRTRKAEDIFCSSRDMSTWDSEYGRMESEANEFASYLLMPLDDFRVQMPKIPRPTVQDFTGLQDRYEVSLTAAILKWLAVTPCRAMIVVSRDGFIDWSRSSTPLLKSGVYFKARQQVTELPAGSLAAAAQEAPEARLLSAGVWSRAEDVFESVLFSEHHGTAISLLIYPKDAPPRLGWKGEFLEEPEPFDTYDQFQRNR
jgi:hypothetical protein